MSAKIIVRRFDGRTAFVPEGQPDSSQARSAWEAMQSGSRPGGTVESLPVPQNIQVFRFNRPAGTELIPYDSRHFVPGYYQPVPPGQKRFAPRSASQLSQRL
jgi:hypothetical protein